MSDVINLFQMRNDESLVDVRAVEKREVVEEKPEVTISDKQTARKLIAKIAICN